MTTYTDEQLKQALAKMLPDELYSHHTLPGLLYWQKGLGEQVLDTELLHFCWLVEAELEVITGANYGLLLDCICGNAFNDGTYKQNTGRKESAAWQQRVIALCKVKGVEIV